MYSIFILLWILCCEAMAEKGVYKRFLRERKKSVKADVVNARKEYESIMSYLQDLMQEVLLRNVNEH